MKDFAKIALTIIAIGASAMYAARRYYEDTSANKKRQRLKAIERPLEENADAMELAFAQRPDGEQLLKRLERLRQRVCAGLATPDISGDNVLLMEIEWDTLNKLYIKGVNK